MSDVRYAGKRFWSAAAYCDAADIRAFARSIALNALSIEMMDCATGGAHIKKTIKTKSIDIYIYNSVVVVGIVENFFNYAEVGKNFFEKISYLEEENKRHFLLSI